MLDASFVEKILESAAQASPITIGGREYATREVFDPRKEDPSVKPLRIATLTGVIDFIKNDLDKDQAAKVQVAGPDLVRVISPIFGDFKQRDVYLESVCSSLFGDSFRFGTFLELDIFLVGMQSLFLPSPDREKILRVLGNVKDESVTTHGDDGVTQTVTARTGIALVAEMPVPREVVLTPFRTFRELDQPSSIFVSRLNQRKDQKPQVALFEADGGKWKIEAIASISTYLRARLPEDFPVVA